MMGRLAFTPSRDKLLCPTGEPRPHVRIPEVKDLPLFVDTLRHNEFKAPIPILRDCKIRDRPEVWIELRKIASTCLAMEDFHNLHRRLFSRDVGVP